MTLRRPYLSWAAALAVCVTGLVVFTYGVPKLIEQLLLLEWGKHARPAVLAFGDGLGCVLLGLYWGARRALFLYALLTVVEFLVFSEVRLRFRELLYFEDSVPALIIMSYVAVVAVRLRPDRARQ